MSEARNNFLKLAGGVYENSEDYDDWRTFKKKKENFWEFFVGKKGFIGSIYACCPVDLLFEENKYSIEHIVPKSFFGKAHESEKINGARTNPLNFVAAHRDVNTKRRVKQFDVQNHKIKKTKGKKRINLTRCMTPNASGPDHQGEWVPPAQSKGNVARILLYMFLVYEIKFDKKRDRNYWIKWAKIDPPDIWEMKYNEWVYSKKWGHKESQIKNPFIADYNNPIEAFKLLEDKELMELLL